MRGSATPQPSAPIGWLGLIRSWWRNGSGDGPSTSPLSEIEYGAVHALRNEHVRVLIVDDNPANLMAISALLEAKGIVPELAADGAQAVALVRGRPFDLILMDLQMPVLDGLEATSAIRLFEHGAYRPAVPVIACTSMSLGAGILAFHGLNGRLEKPCDDQTLEDCLTRWCPGYSSQVLGMPTADSPQPLARSFHN
jgi:CheY-like chemotaxis protein